MITRIVRSILFAVLIIASSAYAKTQMTPEELKSKAEQGDPKAQYALAKYYLNYRPEPQVETDRRGIPIFHRTKKTHQDEDNTQNLVLAVSWLEKAAKQNYRPAQADLGLLYATGRGVSKNLNLAAELLFDDALHGNRHAQQIVDQAANQGNANIQHKLADSGNMQWLRFFAEKGDVASQLTLARRYAQADEGADALKWTNAAAKQGNVEAQRLLGDLYLNGIGVPTNYLLAVQCYQTAIKQGSLSAKVDLGRMYLEGKGVSKNPEEAIKLFTAAAEQGCLEAQYQLVDQYHQGNGVPHSDARALKWLLKAFEHDPVPRVDRLQIVYPTIFPDRYQTVIKWLDTGTDLGRAVHLLADADAGKAQALYEVGKWYRDGLDWPNVGSITQDLAEARKKFTAAAEQGHSEAQADLARLCYNGGKATPAELITAQMWILVREMIGNHSQDEEMTAIIKQKLSAAQQEEARKAAEAMSLRIAQKISHQ